MRHLLYAIPVLLILALVAFVVIDGTDGTPATAEPTRGPCLYASYGPNCEFVDEELLRRDTQAREDALDRIAHDRADPDLNR